MKARKYLRQLLWKKPERIACLFPEDDWQSFTTEDKLAETHSEQLLKQIHQRLPLDEQTIPVRETKEIYWPGVTALAATLLPLLMAVVLWKVSLKDPRHVHPANMPVEMAPLWQTHTNSSEEPFSLVLPDSSIVRLYPHSKLKYLSNFSQTIRESYLEGMAVFEVANDPSRPFSVYAGKTKTTALGTTFTVQANKKNELVTIKLHKGKVQVEAEEANQQFSKRILFPGEHFTFNPSVNERTIKKKAQAEEMLESLYSKTGDALFFKNVQLKEVFEILAEEYQVEILTKTNLDLQPIYYTGEVNVTQEEVEEVLEKICLLNSFVLTEEQPRSYKIQPIQ
ncbi:FecR family protein [Olivibacter sp. SDN3]|uniref:FecR family protein n=1 Tax=Olivibacter sp. SDN3 TaxID=2764720 RepID=UPI001651ACF1|nr:FecR family protein [Olivibacter sp. SDN3]QNL50183.1 FecR family protein [Olivibacter sp. SDN3]